MKLAYAGPKETISAFGVDFKSGKEDKHVYIQPAMQIFKALHHQYEKGIIYHQDVESFKHDDEMILQELFEYDPDLHLNSLSELKAYEEELDLEIEEVSLHKELNEAEQTALKNNLILMKNYRKQRRYNRIIYTALIEMIVDDIFEHKIKQINAPFNERFWHILQTIQGELSNHNRRSIGSNLETHDDDELITIILEINTIL